jgi:hypothetical protein
LPGTTDQLLAGTLRDGDHVDVLANLKSGSCTTCYAVRDVARNLLVLHAPAGSPGGTRVSSGTGASVILAVSDRRESQKIFFAVQNSSGWTLQLRPVANATDAPFDLEGTESLLKDNLSSTSLSHFSGSGK